MSTSKRRRTELRPTLLPGGAVLCDPGGRVRLGVRDEAFDGLGVDAPEHLRLAVAHLAALHAAEEGLVDDDTGAVTIRRTGDSDCHGGGCDEPMPEFVAASSYMSGGLRELALRLRAAGRDVVPVVRTGQTTCVGPVLRSVDGPCMVCVQRAIAPNRQTEGLLPMPSSWDPAFDRVRQIGMYWWRHCRVDLEAGILETDGTGARIARHHVRRFGDCPVCGGAPADPNETPPEFLSRESRASAAGPPTSSPEAAIARFRPLVSPLTGAVRHVTRRDTGDSDLIHIYTAGHAVTMESGTLTDFMQDGRDHSGGKGSTAVQAEASALCEALERFSFVFRGDEVDAIGSHAALEGTLDPSIFMLFSRAQYANRTLSNSATSSRFQKVPLPFDASTDVAWSRVWSLLSHEPAFVPTALLYSGFRSAGAQFCVADTNGLAAGATLEDAVLQGFLELVERDAVALWWYNRTRHEAVDPAFSDDDYVQRLFDYYASLGRHAWVLDLTSDLEIPVYAAISARVDRGMPEVIFGFGCHIDPAIALRKCVLEMNQMLATVMQPVDERHRQLRGDFDDALQWWATATLDEHQHLLPVDGAVRRPAGPTLGGHAVDEPGGAVQTCLEVARRHDLTVYVRDMTRSDVGLPVVKVLVPGLRHFWRRTAPGRLYDAPVRMGRRQTPLDETELNPVSLFV